jgi:hypothetical protein
MKGHLIGFETDDYTLDIRSNSAWVTVGNISAKITRTDDRVFVHLYAVDNEMGPMLDFAEATFEEAQKIINEEV